MKTLLKVLWWPAIVLVVHVLLTYTNGYDWWAHVDKIMHVLGGMSIAAGSLYALQAWKKILVVPAKRISIYALGCVLTAALLWELYEFTWDVLYNTHLQANTIDSITDVVAGMAGAGLVVTWWKKKR